MADDDDPPPRATLPRIANLGASAQAAIPALYAWGLTVAPAAWAKRALAFDATVSQGFAILGLVFVAAAIVVEQKRPEIARPLSVWGLVCTSVVVWALSGLALGPARLDVTRGLLGAAGWLLFAFASSAPPIRRRSEIARIAAGPRLKPRGSIPRFDAVYIIFGVVAALGFQTIGWRIVAVERAILVRLVLLAAGLAVLGACTDIAVARHGARVQGRSARRIRRALPLLVLLVVMCGVALFVLLLR